MKHFTFFLIIVLCAGFASGAEPKPLEQIKLVKFVKETQKADASDSLFDLVWLIPTEYWECAMRQDKNISKAQLKQNMELMKPYFLLGVVRADISAFGGFNFYDKKTVKEKLVFSYIDTAGKKTELKSPQKLKPDMKNLLDIISPILANAMGRMGQNFHLYVFKNEDNKGRQIIDIYKKGEIKAKLEPVEKGKGRLFNFEMPLDCLYIPRQCCKKPMHISWQFCPICGEKLKP